MQAFERIEFPKNGELHLKNLPLEEGKAVRVIIVPVDEKGTAPAQNVEADLWAVLGVYTMIRDDEGSDVRWEEVFGV